MAGCVDAPLSSAVRRFLFLSFVSMCCARVVIAAILWGASDCGGTPEPGELASVVAALLNLDTLYGTYCSFAALTNDGEVLAWGDGGVLEWRVLVIWRARDCEGHRADWQGRWRPPASRHASGHTERLQSRR